jgi:hypothetical protein
MTWVVSQETRPWPTKAKAVTRGAVYAHVNAYSAPNAAEATSTHTNSYAWSNSNSVTNTTTNISNVANANNATGSTVTSAGVERLREQLTLSADPRDLLAARGSLKQLLGLRLLDP